jgi:two-component system, response regulator RegA
MSATPPPDSAPAPAPDSADPISLLLVDDDPTFRARLARAMQRRGFAVREANNYDEAIAAAQADPPEMAIIDLRMPGRSGLEVLRDLLDIEPHTKVVVLTGYGSIATAVDAVRLGAINYLAKPADADDILTAFARGSSPPLSTLPPSFQAPSLARAEWEHIQRVLVECGNNISQCARRLGIHRRTLQRKLDKYPPSI